MNTELLSASDTTRAARYLKQGKLVVIPTETVYGLGVRCDDPAGIDAVFIAKGRPQDNPLIVHVSSLEMAHRYAIVDSVAERLFSCFSPGPLTLVLPARSTVALNARAGLSTVAIRIPGHPVARTVIEQTDLGVAAPSANRSGRPSPTTARAAYDEMQGRVSAVIDGGSCDLGIESTVAVLREGGPHILRPGRITRDDLNQCLDMTMHEAADVDVSEQVLSPGTRHRHYSPDGNLCVVNGAGELSAHAPFDETDALICISKAVASEFTAHGGRESHVQRATDEQNYEHNLYEWFYWSERNGFRRLLVELPAGNARTVAIRDRILRAAGRV